MERLNDEHFRCTCFSHSVSVSRFEGFPEVEIDFWHTPDTNLSWRTFWQRLRDAWKVIRGGNILTHGVILEPQQAEKMGRKLLELTKEKRGD